MSSKKPLILLVDDEPFNLKILEEHLEDAGYETLSANNGLEAWEILEKSHKKFDAVLLDRMMPEMDGMSVLKKMKSHAGMNKLPVVMQTAKAAKNEVLEGLNAGVHYYLTKPYGKDQLLAIVKTVVQDYIYLRELKSEISQKAGVLTLMNHGQFEVKTLDEIHTLTTLLVSHLDNSEKVGMGLSELLVNSFEHGNLGINYETKSELNLKGTWAEEVERRATLPENKEKKIIVEYVCNEKEITFLITDEGDGFDWQKYMEISPERAFDSHGRGIAMANLLSFDNIEYIGAGNQVKVSLYKDCENH